MTDGWEAGGLCAYDAGRVGVNPLNGSDGLENPDGDGFDVNLDGVLEPGEAYVNWLEFHIKDLDVVDGAITFGAFTAPEGLDMSLFEGMLLGDEPAHGFIDDADLATLATAVPAAIGSTDPWTPTATETACRTVGKFTSLVGRFSRTAGPSTQSIEPIASSTPTTTA